VETLYSDHNHRILYVCPFAHYVGHYPYVTSVEPRMLAENGVDVKVLTYAGITNNPQMDLPCQEVGDINNRLTAFCRRFTLGRWLVMLYEVYTTLNDAMKIAYDENRIIHLRDGDLYMPLHHILALSYRNLRWCVSMTAGMLYPPKLGGQTNLRGNLALLLYWIGVKVLMGGWMKPIYRMSMKRNRYHYFTQNETAKIRMEQFCGGVFKGRVDCVPLPVDISVKPMDKIEARKKLCLPLDKIVLLSFGSWHSGKDMQTVFKAVASLNDGGVHYVCAGR